MDIGGGDAGDAYNARKKVEARGQHGLDPIPRPFPDLVDQLTPSMPRKGDFGQDYILKDQIEKSQRARQKAGWEEADRRRFGDPRFAPGGSESGGGSGMDEGATGQMDGSEMPSGPSAGMPSAEPQGDFLAPASSVEAGQDVMQAGSQAQGVEGQPTAALAHDFVHPRTKEVIQVSKPDMMKLYQMAKAGNPGDPEQRKAWGGRTAAQQYMHIMSGELEAASRKMLEEHDAEYGVEPNATAQTSPAAAPSPAPPVHRPANPVNVSRSAPGSVQNERRQQAIADRQNMSSDLPQGPKAPPLPGVGRVMTGGASKLMNAQQGSGLDAEGIGGSVGSKAGAEAGRDPLPRDRSSRNQNQDVMDRYRARAKVDARGEQSNLYREPADQSIGGFVKGAGKGLLKEASDAAVNTALPPMMGHMLGVGNAIAHPVDTVNNALEMPKETVRRATGQTPRGSSEDYGKQAGPALAGLAVGKLLPSPKLGGPSGVAGQIERNSVKSQVINNSKAPPRRGKQSYEQPFEGAEVGDAPIVTPPPKAKAAPSPREGASPSGKVNLVEELRRKSKNTEGNVEGQPPTRAGGALPAKGGSTASQTSGTKTREAFDKAVFDSKQSTSGAPPEPSARARFTGSAPRKKGLGGALTKSAVPSEPTIISAREVKPVAGKEPMKALGPGKPSNKPARPMPGAVKEGPPIPLRAPASKTLTGQDLSKVNDPRGNNASLIGEVKKQAATATDTKGQEIRDKKAKVNQIRMEYQPAAKAARKDSAKNAKAASVREQEANDLADKAAKLERRQNKGNYRRIREASRSN